MVLGLGSATAGEKGQGLSAEEALKRLEEGNARFVADTPQHPHEARPWRSRLEKGQQPFAVILGCSDSRVPPELVFDQRFGDLFVVRVAGNVVDTDVTASIEYAVDHLGTRLILVLGHSHCGAVTAALDLLGDPDGEPAEIVSLLYRMEPAVMGLPKQLTREQRIEQAVSRNVQRSVQRLSRVPDLRRKMKAGTIRIVGAVFDMHTGQVELVK
ncbi:MAG TPA: carbonic anhydrase [Planctomycetaceae bacterium]|nr:carbonic anhydrase [Planctomycetaceae bacterium]